MLFTRNSGLYVYLFPKFQRKITLLDMLEIDLKLSTPVYGDVESTISTKNFTPSIFYLF